MATAHASYSGARLVTNIVDEDASAHARSASVRHRRSAGAGQVGAANVELAGDSCATQPNRSNADSCLVTIGTGDAVAEEARLKAEDGGAMGIGGATLAGAAMRAGLIDEYQLATCPVLVGGGTPFFAALDRWVNLNLVETRTFPNGVVLTRYETRR